MLLRTTADILDHAVIQAQCCAEQWPEYQREVDRFSDFVDRLSGAAQKLGHQPRRKWSVPA